MKASYLLVHIFVLLFAVNLVHAQAPASPTNGNATAISRTQLVISWEDNSNNEDRFLVFDFEESSFSGEFPPLELLLYQFGTSSVGGTGPIGGILIDETYVSGDRVKLAGGMRVRYAVYAFNPVNGISQGKTVTPEVRMPDEVFQSEYQALFGQDFSAVLYSDDSGLQTSASLSDLPNWATFDEATRTLSGTPDAAGIHSLDLVVNYSDGFSINETITLEVPMTGTITRYGHQATVGQNFSAEFYTDDSGLQNSASTTITGLPDWANFDKATRTVSGIPDAEGVHSLNLDINYSDGFNIAETVPLRVLPAASGPILVDTLPSPEYHPNIETQSIDLKAYFTDPDCSRAVRMTFSNLGIVDIILYENATPDTVSNFLTYVSEDPSTGQNRYNGSMIHRSVSGFVIQGGGFRPIGGNNFSSVPVFTVEDELMMKDKPKTVDNEPGLENVRGTISMAKQENDPDSATNQWFISLADNRANLDFQNGGFTVFGRVAGNGMAVVDAISDLPRGNYPNIKVDGVTRSGLLNECPMNVTTTTAPASMEQDKLVVLESAIEIDPLTYSIVSNSDPSVAEATVSNGTLQVTPLKSGTCTLKIRATDLDDNQIEEDVAITVTSWTFDDWSVAQGIEAGQGGVLDDADGDSLPNFIEYALFGDAKTSTPSLTKSQKVSAGTSATEDYLAIEFSTRNGIQDTRVCVEAVDQLSPDATWTEIWNSSQGSDAAQVHSADVATDHIDWVIRDTQPDSSSASRFMRVRVERADSQ